MRASALCALLALFGVVAAFSGHGDHFQRDLLRPHRIVEARKVATTSSKRPKTTSTHKTTSHKTTSTKRATTTKKSTTQKTTSTKQATSTKKTSSVRTSSSVRSSSSMGVSSSAPSSQSAAPSSMPKSFKNLASSSKYSCPSSDDLTLYTSSLSDDGSNPLSCLYLDSDSQVIDCSYDATGTSGDGSPCPSKASPIATGGSYCFSSCPTTNVAQTPLDSISVTFFDRDSSNMPSQLECDYGFATCLYAAIDGTPLAGNVASCPDVSAQASAQSLCLPGVSEPPAQIASTPDLVNLVSSSYSTCPTFGGYSTSATLTFNDPDYSSMLCQYWLGEYNLDCSYDSAGQASPDNYSDYCPSNASKPSTRGDLCYVCLLNSPCQRTQTSCYATDLNGSPLALTDAEIDIGPEIVQQAAAPTIQCPYAYDQWKNTASCTYDLGTGQLVSSFVGANCQAMIPLTSTCLRNPNAS